MSDNPTIIRSREAVSLGQLWKAKEILQGRIASHPFDPEIFEEYGVVLLEMGDKLHAGRYLFLSGARKEEYLESIELFLNRFAKSNPGQFHATFPASARKVKIEDLPSQVATELAQHGFKAADLNRQIREPQKKPGPGEETLWKYGCLGVAAAVFILIVIGFVTVVQRVIQWF